MKHATPFLLQLLEMMPLLKLQVELICNKTYPFRDHLLPVDALNSQAIRHFIPYTIT